MQESIGFLTETCKSFVKYNHEIVAGNQSDIGWTILSSFSKPGLEGVVRNGGLLISANDLHTHHKVAGIVGVHTLETGGPGC